jgi:hypothetical protein
MFESAAYADFSGLLAPLGAKLSDKIGYILLDLLGRSIFEYLAFCSVTELWLQTALQASPTTSPTMGVCLLIRTFNRVLGSVNVGCSVVLAGYLMVDLRSLAKIEQNELLFRLQILMESICWMASAAFVLICIKVTFERIQLSFSTFSPANTLERVSLNAQALVPMAVCALCYIVRSVFLFCRMIGETPLIVSTNRFHPVWWVAFVWGPTLLVVTMALYSARRRDRILPSFDTGDGEDSDFNEPLLRTPMPPPAEAFQNFRRYADSIISPFGNTTPGATPNISMDAGNNLGETTEV